MAKNYQYKQIKLIQDNDPKHKSKICKEALDLMGIKWVK